jgi:hypothetical protein
MREADEIAQREERREERRGERESARRRGKTFEVEDRRA